MSEYSAARILEGAPGAARLRELGVSEEELVNAVLAAEIERRSCSPFEPSTAPGFKAWAAAIRTLAEQLIPRAWVKTETRGLPRILDPTSRVAITVGSGDENTGRVSNAAEPKTKSPRGVQSVLFVRSNQQQLNLFDEGAFRPIPDEAEQITWWLLIFSDGENTLRAELSLPVGLGDDRRISDWEERIILVIDDPLLVEDSDDDSEPPIDLEIPVRPRRR